MGKSSSTAGFHHRATLTQKNRPYKGTPTIKRKRGNEQLRAKLKVPQTKIDRLVKTSQRRNRSAANVEEKWLRELRSTVPRLVVVVSFNHSADVGSFMAGIVTILDGVGGSMDVKPNKEASNLYTINLPKTMCRTRNRLQFFVCDMPTEIPEDSNDRRQLLLSILDMCKTADIILGVFGDASLEARAFTEFGYELKSLLVLQGVPLMIGAAIPSYGMLESLNLDTLKEQSRLKFVNSNFDIVKRCFITEFPESQIFDLVDSMLSLRSGNFSGLNEKQKSHVTSFLRLLGVTGVKELSWRESCRGYMVAEKVEVDSENRHLIVEGYARGLGFTCRYPVHITGVCDLPCVEMGVHNSLSREFDVVESLDQKEVFERVWSEYAECGDEVIEHDECFPVECVALEDESKDEYYEKVMKKFYPEPKEAPKLKGVLQARLKSEMQFVDEVDTPNDERCSERYKNYRPLVNLMTSVWNRAVHDTPDYYSKLYNIKPYKATMKEVWRWYEESMKLGESRYLRLKFFVPEEYESRVSRRTVNMEKWPLVISTMSPVERKISVQHFSIERFSGIGDSLLPSKAIYEIQCGFRRLIGRPLFSQPLSKGALKAEVGNVSNHKLLYRRFLSADDSRRYSCASLIGPTIGAACPVIFWLIDDLPEEIKERSSEDGLNLGKKFLVFQFGWLAGRNEIVAFGKFIGTDPDRLLIKRIYLTGYPTRITKRKCVVTRMFWNAEDVNHYKDIPLTTAKGKVGRIIQSIGIHGDMKVVMDSPMNQSDTVSSAQREMIFFPQLRMALYRRVVPPFRPA